MSKYTTEVRYICESLAGQTESKGYSEIKDILEDAAPLIFSFDYPIFDENYRLPLEMKILKHYYTREISEETYGLWKLRLDAKMNEIMPKYNALYKTTVFDFNPAYDTDYSVVHSGADSSQTNNQRNGTSAETYGESGLNVRNTETETDREMKQKAVGSKSANETQNRTDSAEENANTKGMQTGTADAWDLYSDTPQGGLTGVRSNDYLTNARNNTNANNMNSDETVKRTNDYDSETKTQNAEVTAAEKTDSTTGSDSVNERTQTLNNRNRNAENGETVTGTVNSTNSYIERVVGTRNPAGFARNILEFRKTLINIDMMIIDELSTLFFGLW